MIREYSLRNCSCDGVLRLRQWSEWGKKDSEMYVPSAACWSVESVEVSEPVLSVLPVEVSEPEVSLAGGTGSEGAIASRGISHWLEMIASNGRIK